MKNKENGITLIALIITIIVMLILVVVTINVALNGGLFDKAKTASDQTNLAKEKETLQAKALGYLNNNGYVDLAEFVSKESPLEGYTLTNNTTYATATNGTNTFYITKEGGITETEPQVNIDDLIPTAEQKADARTNHEDEGDSYEFLHDILDYIETESNSFKYIQIYYNETAYIWACDDNTAKGMKDMLLLDEMQVNKWYVGTTTFGLYEGPCPINKSSFAAEDIRSEEYLDRVIASFSSTNN